MRQHMISFMLTCITLKATYCIRLLHSISTYQSCYAHTSAHIYTSAHHWLPVAAANSNPTAFLQNFGWGRAVELITVALRARGAMASFDPLYSRNSQLLKALSNYSHGNRGSSAELVLEPQRFNFQAGFLICSKSSSKARHTNKDAKDPGYK
jgi:hypothetical protein